MNEITIYFRCSVYFTMKYMEFQRVGMSTTGILAPRAVISIMYNCPRRLLLMSLTSHISCSSFVSFNASWIAMCH